MGLVDYDGSGSDSDADSGGEEVLPPTRAKEPVKEPVTSDLPDNFFDDSVAMEEGDTGVFSALPSIVESTTSGVVDGEEELEPIVQPKEWEKKLAEKERRKLEKKAKKREEKEKRKAEKKAAKAAQKGKAATEAVQPKKEKAKIAAFGALRTIAATVSSDEEDEAPKPAVVEPKKTGSGLLSMLPAPKTSLGAKKLGEHGAFSATNALLPSSLRNKRPAEAAPKGKSVAPKRAALVAASDSDSDGEDGDFFGLTSAAKPIRPSVVAKSAVPIISSTGLASGDAYAPERPLPGSFTGYEDDEDDMEAASSSAGAEKTVKRIGDKEATRLIHQHEFAPWGVHRQAAADAAAGIIDVNVDQALGDNIRTTLLRNLNHKAMLKNSMPSLPKAGDGGKDVNSKRKHQITYLAKVAVAREEALQDQWAQSKQMKRMTRQKYGF